jgi:hypothetical protein
MTVDSLLNVISKKGWILYERFDGLNPMRPYKSSKRWIYM